jgi:hypothetical protein
VLGRQVKLVLECTSKASKASKLSTFGEAGAEICQRLLKAQRLKGVAVIEPAAKRSEHVR